MTHERPIHTSHRLIRAVTGQCDRSKVVHQCDRDKEETYG